HGNKVVSIIGFAPAPKTSLVTLASHQKRWFTFAWQSSEELFSPTKDLLLWTSAAGFLSILLLTLLGALSADKFVGPIRELQKTAAAIGRGEKVEPLKIKTGDEIELLSDEINHMKSLLDKAFTGLEDEVRIKTKEALYLKEYTKSILMSVPSVLIVFNEKLQIELVNAAFEKLTGAKGPDVIGKTLIDAHLKFSDKWEDLAEQLGSFANSEVNLVSRDYKGKDPLAPSTVKNQRDKLPTINYGDYIFAYQFFEIGIKEDDSRHIGLILKDITEEKSLMDRLTLADKLSGLGTMAAGIAHEMNNPLFAIMGYSEAILRENEPSKIKNFASKIFEQSKHMSSVILNLTGYTSPNQDELCEVNLNERLDA
ncbi:MAG: PAS domain-containing protein, partial [Nitrospinae bacterium]|nr:PAS domain-containing protein [Nitrospinota bacterium]